MRAIVVERASVGRAARARRARKVRGRVRGRVDARTGWERWFWIFVRGSGADRDGSVARERGAVTHRRRGGERRSHLASSATLYVRRALAEDEGNTAWAAARRRQACGGGAMDAYAPGELASSPFRDRVEVFLTKNVGRFMDVDESLIARHVEREDETSALVAAGGTPTDRTRWARPHGVNADTLMRYGRAVERGTGARGSEFGTVVDHRGRRCAVGAHADAEPDTAGRSGGRVRRTLDGGDVDMTGNADDGQPPPTRRSWRSRARRRCWTRWRGG